MLRDDQRDELNLIAQSEDSSLSEVVRQFVDAQLRQHRYDQMRDSAAILQSDYEKGGSLHMTELDGEDFVNV
jgi:hypothetical protein